MSLPKLARAQARDPLRPPPLSLSVACDTSPLCYRGPSLYIMDLQRQTVVATKKLNIITDMQTMLRIRDGVFLATQRGTWRTQLQMDESHGVTPELCVSLALYIIDGKYSRYQRKFNVWHEYSFENDEVLFFLHIQCT